MAGESFTTPAASHYSTEAEHDDSHVVEVGTQMTKLGGKELRETVFSYIHAITALMNCVMFFVFAVIASHFFVESL